MIKESEARPYYTFDVVEKVKATLNTDGIGHCCSAELLFATKFNVKIIFSDF